MKIAGCYWIPMKANRMAKESLLCGLQLWIPCGRHKGQNFHSMLTALYCCFSRAHQLANHALCAYYKNHALWNAMGMVPSSLVHSIAQKAELILVPNMAVQKRLLQSKE